MAADLWPQPRVVSPDGDGYADLLTVRYTLSEPSTVSAEVKDERGLTVTSLAINTPQQAGRTCFRGRPTRSPTAAIGCC